MGACFGKKSKSKETEPPPPPVPVHEFPTTYFPPPAYEEPEGVCLEVNELGTVISSKALIGGDCKGFKVPLPNKIWGTTKMESFEFTWKIDQFPVWLLQIDDKHEYSPSFSTGIHQWRLSLKKRTQEGMQDFVGLFIWRHQSPKVTVFAGFKFAILNDDGQKTRETSVYYKTFGVNKDQGTGWGMPQFMRKDILLDKRNGHLSKSDSITIMAEVYIFSESVMY